MYKLVEEMHYKFVIPEDDSHESMLFRIAAMQEEIAEFTVATLKGDRHDQLDALIDLVVFTFGTAILMGIDAKNFEGAFNEVMKANLEKKLARIDAKDSKRGWSLDLVKPEGWKPADLTRFINSKQGDLNV